MRRLSSRISDKLNRAPPVKADWRTLRTQFRGADHTLSLEVVLPPLLKFDRSGVETERFDGALRNGIATVGGQRVDSCTNQNNTAKSKRTLDKWQSLGRTVSPSFGPSSTRTRFSPTSRGGWWTRAKMPAMSYLVNISCAEKCRIGGIWASDSCDLTVIVEERKSVND